MKIKVLVVGLDKAPTDDVVDQLVKRGIAVEAAYDCKSAVRFLKDRAVDVVVLDMKMPGIGGIDTLRAVKKVRPEAEVIMLADQRTIDMAIQGIKVGALQYLIKPWDLVVLPQTIRAACRKKRSQMGDDGP